MTGSRYPQAYAAWQADPEAWWMRAAAALDWDRAPRRAFDPAAGAFGQWFPDARLNVCHNALDRHVDAGRGAQPALVWDSPAAGERRTFTYAGLRDDTARLAGALAASGVRAGDRVVITMPMVPEAVMAMLACARLGAVHSVVFGGFAAPELAKRIEDARPRVVVSASCGIEPGRLVAYRPLLDDALALSAHQPERCLVLQRPMLRADLRAGRDADLAEAMAAADPHPCVPVAATDPLYILYTSGTTGKPKGVVRDGGGHAVALLHSMASIYGRRPGETFWCASDIGWVVGHSYIVYAPLLAGCTTVLYEGKPVGTPDAGAFWRVCAEHGVRLLFTAPTALRAIRQQDPDGRHIGAHDLSRLDALYLAGERCDPATATWAAARLGVPVVDHWWQTETGWPITASFLGHGLFPPLPGSAGRACPGYDVAALDDAGAPLPRGAPGTLALRLPLPPGCAPTLWGGPDATGRAAGIAAYRAAYLRDTPGWYRTGDAGTVDASGDVWVMGRTDDLINVAGHRLSTGQMEEVLSAHPDVAECAVVGAADPIKGQVPLGLVVLSAGARRDEAEVCAELVALVRARIGPVAALRDVRVLARLPKTRSGKILRASIRRLADGQDPNPPPTIDDPAALDDVRAALLRKAPAPMTDPTSAPLGTAASPATPGTAAPLVATPAPAPPGTAPFPAILIPAKGAPAALATLAPAELMPGGVLLRVTHSTLNYKDGLALTGRSPVVRRWPMVPGIDLAGEVLESDSPEWRPGDRVVLNGWGLGETHMGGYATRARVDPGWLVPLPGAFSPAQAMAIGTAGYTAMLAVLALERHGLRPADGPVLVTGAAGGVGSVAVALLARLGWHVLASTGRAAEAGYLRALGAAEVLDRAELSSPGRPLAPERWAAAVDAVGSHTLASVLAATRRGGAVAACGLAAGMDLPASVAPFILRGVALLGIDSAMCPRPRRLEAWGRLATDLDPARLASMTRTVRLDEVLALAPRILDGQVRGRVVVEVG